MMEVNRVVTLLGIICLQLGADAFTVPATLSSTRTYAAPGSSSSCLFAGMGMAVKSKGKKKGSKKKSGISAAPFDAAASLLKLEKKHEDMMAKSAKVLNKHEDDISDNDMVVSEFVVAARSARSSIGTADLTAVADWIPVAQLTLARPIRDVETSEGSADKVVNAAISYYCREISQAASFSAPKFRAVPRQETLYSVESMDSFQKHVYDHFNGKKAGEDGSMTKAEARKILNLDDGASEKAEIKQSYRKLTFKLHPDRFVGVDRTEEEASATNDEFAQVKLAFDTLSSGVSDGNGSWYRSLGGKDRVDFISVDLLSINDAKTILDSVKHDAAVVGLDPELVQMFVLRNQNA